MKVILTQDVYKHGVAGEVVSVANGFARNYLIPQNMAIKASTGALKQYAQLRAQAAKRREVRDSELYALAERIEGLTLSFPVRASEQGKLYGSVTTAHIAEAMEEALETGIDRRRIGDRPLRELGEHQVGVRLSSGLAPAVRILIHREGEEPESVLGVSPASVEEEEEAEAVEQADMAVEGEADAEVPEEAVGMATADEGEAEEAPDVAADEMSEADAEVPEEAIDMVAADEGEAEKAPDVAADEMLEAEDDEAEA